MLSMLPILRSLMIVFLAAIFVAGSATAFQNIAVAQVSGPDKPTAGATPGGVDSGSASDAELWRQIRRGDSGTVVGGDKSGGMMIQSGGQDWRLMRNGPLPKYVAWAILGMLFLLALFFALRGRMKIAHGPSGQTMNRFSLIERVGHWLLASSFILLALTGLNLIFGKALLIPLFGKEVFASITLFGKFVHNYVAFAFILGLIMITLMWIVHNIPSWTDVKWLLRGGGMIGGGHPPARKFNAGQKIIFWVVVLCGISISMSGWALMNPFTTNMFSGTFALANDWFGTSYATDLAPIQEQQYQSLWHTIMAAFMIVVILAHIYIGSVGMEGALPAMTTGDVDTNWAREHHSLWVEEEEAKHWGKPTQIAAATSGTAALSAPSARLAAAAGVSVASTSVRDGLPRVDSASDSYAVRRRAAFSADANAGSSSPEKNQKRRVAEAKPRAPEPKKASKPKKTRVTATKTSAKTSKASASKTKAPAKPKATVKAKVPAKPKAAAKAKAATKTKAASGKKPVVKAATSKKATKRASTKSVAKAVAKPKTTAKSTAAKKPRSTTKRRTRDDLKLIKGVGPLNEKKLNAIGVRHFEDVAKWTKKQQSDIGDRLAFPGRIEREEWVKQAKVLAKDAKKG